MAKISGFYLVTDRDGNVTWDPDGDAPETFSTSRSAMSRARRAASDEPTKTFYVAKAVRCITFPIDDPVVVDCE